MNVPRLTSASALERIPRPGESGIQLSRRARHPDVELDGPGDASERRVVERHLEAGEAREAAAALESMISDGALFWDLVDLFEALSALPGQDRAIARLSLHYECAADVEGGARLRRTKVHDARTPHERARRVRELVRFRLQHAVEDHGPLARRLERICDDLAGSDAALAPACRAVLVHALRSWRTAPTDDAFDDAAETVWRTIERLSSILLRRGEVAKAARLLVRGAALRFEPARQRALLRQAAFLYADRLRDRATAIRLFKRIFDDCSGDEIARSSFDRFASLLQVGGHDRKLAWLYDLEGRRAACAGDEARARVSLERAGRRWEQAHDPAKACEAYALGAALGSIPSLEALSRIHAARESWREAATALEQLIARTDEEGWRTHGLRLAEAYLALGEVDRARGAVEGMIEAAPELEGEPAARALVLEIHRRVDEPRSLAERLEAEALRHEGRRAAALFEEAADVLGERLGDARASARLLDLARRAEPSSAALKRRLARALCRLEMWDALAEVLAEHAQRHGRRRAAELVDLRLRLAEGLAQGGRTGDALAQLKLALTLDPAHVGVLEARARLELSAGEHDAAERTLRAALLVAKSSRRQRDPGLRRRIYVGLSAIARARGDEPRARGLLESALEAATDDGDDLRVLADALRSHSQFDLLACALEAFCARAPSASEGVSAFASLVETWRRHLVHDRATELAVSASARAVARALAADVETRADEATWERLEATCAPLDDHALSSVLARARRDAVRAAAPGAGRARHRVGLAKILVRRLGERAEAIEQLTAALADDPAHAEASRLLAGVLAGEGRFDEAASVLEDRLARLDERDPESLDVAWQLARVLEGGSRRREASDLYEVILDAAPGCSTDTAHLRILAERLDELESPRLADCIERLCVLEPGSVEALAPRLIDLRTASGDDRGLARALRIGLRARPSDRSFLRRLVDVEVRSGSAPECLRLLDVAIAARPDDVELRLLRARVRERSGDFAGVLSDLHARGGRESVAIAARILARSDVALTNEQAIMAADIVTRGGRHAEAEAGLEAVLRRDPGDAGALQRLAAARATRGDWGAAADLYRRLLEALALPASDPASGALVVEFADACLRAGRAGDAREALERALAQRPGDTAIEAQLERTCEATRSFRRLSELFLTRARRTRDARERSKLLLRAARIHAEACGGATSTT